MSTLAAVAGFAARLVDFLLALPGRLLAWYENLRPIRWLLGLLERVATAVRARVVVLLSLVLAALAFVSTLGELSALLGEMHVPGAASYRAEGLSRALHLPSPAHARTVLETWDGLGAALTRSADSVFRWYVLVDFLFIPVYATLIAVFLFWIRQRLASEKTDDALLNGVVRRRLRRRGEPEDDDVAFALERDRVHALLSAYQRMLRLSLLALPGLVFADVIEDAAALVLPSLDHGSGAFTAVYLGLWASGTLKLVLGLLMFVAGVVAALSFSSSGRPNMQGRRSARSSCCAVSCCCSSCSGPGCSSGISRRTCSAAGARTRSTALPGHC
jgi:hypothetical protein